MTLPDLIQKKTTVNLPQKAQKAQKDPKPNRVKKRQPSGWNLSVVRYPYSVGHRIQPLPFCVFVPFVAIASGGSMAKRRTQGTEGIGAKRRTL
ncbi:MAG: hypothetical protein OXH06_15360 [Gemmatimonadetes bacterium]|nr:hypothetical protein [Gemmatimonadota bacterium]